MAPLRVCGLRHPRVRDAHRRLAGYPDPSHGPDARCVGAGSLRPTAGLGAGTGAPQSSRGTGLSIRYTERLAEAGIEPSVGSRGDSYDNILAESVIGLYKTEVINRRGPWRHSEAVELATPEWVDWFNNRRLLAPIGYVPPVECKEQYYRSQADPAMLAGVT